MSVRRLTLSLNLDDSGFSMKLRDASGRLIDLGNASERVARSVRNIERRVNGAAAGLRDFTVIVGQARSAINNLRFIMLDWVTAIVRSNAEIERMTFLIRGLSTATESAEVVRETADNFQYLIRVAQNAPFAINAITDTFVKMSSVGIDPTSGALQSLVDAVAAFGGTEQTLHRASIAIQQMAGKGVISMEELRQQLGEAVPTALPMLARALNTSVEELVEQISLGRVQAAPALQALFNEFEMAFGGSAQRLMDTFSGRLSRLQTEFRLFALEVGGFDDATASFGENGLMAMLGDQVTRLTDALSDPRAIQFAQQLAAVMIETAQAISDFAVAAYEAREVIGRVATAIGAILAFNMVISIIRGIGSAWSMATGFIARSITAVQTQTGALSANTQAMINNARASQSRTAANREKNRVEQINITQTIAATQAQIARLRADVAQTQSQLALTRSTLAKTRADYQLAIAMARINGNYAVANRLQATMVRQTRAVQATEQLLIRTKRELTLAQEQLNGAIARQNTLQSRAAVLNNRVGQAARGLAGGIGMAARGVLSLVGGIPGLILTLGSLAVAFLDVRTAVQRAREALDDFNNYGIADADGIDQLRAAIASLENQIEALERLNRTRMIPTGNHGYRFLTPEEIEINERMIEDFQRQIDEYTEGRDRMIDELSRREAEQAVNSMNRAMRGRLEANGRMLRDELNNIHEQIEAAGRDEELSETQRQERIDELIEQRIQARIDAGNRHIAILQEQMAEEQSVLESGDIVAGTQGYENSIARIDALNEQILQVRDSLEEIRTTSSTRLEEILMGGGDDDDSPITRLRDELAELRIEMQSGGDAARAMAMRIREGLVEGVEEGTDAARDMIEMARQLQALENQRDALQNDRSTLERLRDDANSAREAADEMVASILGGTDDVDGNLGRISGRLRTMIEGMTTSQEEAETLFGEIMDARRLENVAKGIADIRDETRNMNLDLLEGRDRVIASYEQDIARAERLRQEWIALGRDVAEVDEIVDNFLNARAAQFEREMETPLEKLAREWADVTTQMENAQAQWMDDFVQQLVRGEASFGDFAIAILEDIAQIRLQAQLAGFIETFLGGITKSIGGWFGGGGSTSLDGLLKQGTNVAAHTGGVAGKATGMTVSAPNWIWAGAPRLHTGGIAGLKNDEVPTILRRGEGVFTPEQMKALGGGVGDVQVPINFNLINESGQPLEAQEQGRSFDGEQYIVDVVVRNLNRPGRMRDAVRASK